jgi:hypothetical protein
LQPFAVTLKTFADVRKWSRDAIRTRCEPPQRTRGAALQRGSWDVRHESSGAEDADEHAGSPEAERRARLEQLLVRDTKLSADEAVALREVFPEILAAHEDQVWSRLRRRGLEGDEVRTFFRRCSSRSTTGSWRTGFRKA